MNIEYIKKKNLKDSPGVYMFLDEKRKPLYIGSATSIYSRVRSYFLSNLVETRGYITNAGVKNAKHLKVIYTDSALESFILESKLLKKHSPRYNIKGKDNKSFQYIVITEEEYPRVIKVRGREIEKKLKNVKLKRVFGPFPKSGVLNDAIKIIRKLFPFRDKCSPGSSDSKCCFYYQIGLCPGVCCSKMTKREYQRRIKEIMLFLDCKKDKIIEKLDRDIEKLVKKQEFELAQKELYRKTLLQNINDVSLIKRDYVEDDPDKSFRMEAYDVSHLRGSSPVGVMVVSYGGEFKKSEYRKFIIKGDSSKESDADSLKEIFTRRMARDWEMPSLIVVDGGVIQMNVVKRVLKQLKKDIAVVGVVKDERHRAKRIAGDSFYAKEKERDIIELNGEAHRFAISFHRKRRSKIV